MSTESVAALMAVALVTAVGLVTGGLNTAFSQHQEHDDGSGLTVVAKVAIAKVHS